jgi:hypothetical protein
VVLATAVKPLLFIHIRKTAGSSLRSLLANQFPASEVFSNAHSVQVRHRWAPIQPGEKPSLTPNAQFVTGHLDFDFVSRFARPPMVLTVLREPIALVLSAYNFYRGNDEPFFSMLRDDWSAAEYESRRHFTNRARRLGLRRFLTEEEATAGTWLSNVQTRQLAGASCADLTVNDPRLLETALANLKRCDLVGLVERLDETLLLLGQMMGWGRIGPIPHLNKTPDTGADEVVDAESSDILRSWNALDLRLYDAACSLFEDKVAAVGRTRLERPDLDETSLPDGAYFTPEQPVRGYGWHEREFHQGRWLCWNSSPTATLALHRTELAACSRFQCLVTHAVGPAALDSLRVSLNGAPLVLHKRQQEDGYLLEGTIPPEGVIESRGQLAEIMIRCPIMQRPCDINPGSPDRRQLGVALAWVRID